MRQGIFFFSLPESTFSADSLTVSRTPPCATACINICAHIKDLVVHVRVWWIMETLKHPACTVGWVAQLCCSWLSLEKQPEFPTGEIPFGQYICEKEKKKEKVMIFLCVFSFLFSRYVQSVHWSCLVEQDACFMAAVHQQNVTVWRVSGAVPRLAFKQVRKINVQPVPQGKISFFLCFEFDRNTFSMLDIRKLWDYAQSKCPVLLIPPLYVL